MKIGANGLPSQAIVSAKKSRRGLNTTATFTVLDGPVSFDCLVKGVPVPMEVKRPIKILSQTPSTVKWEAALAGGDLALNISGLMDFDSYLEFSVTVQATGANPVALSDIRVRVQPTNATVLQSPRCRSLFGHHRQK